MSIRSVGVLIWIFFVIYSFPYKMSINTQSLQNPYCCYSSLIFLKLEKHKVNKNFTTLNIMYKITAYTAKTSNKKYWCQYNLWTGDFPAYIVGCLITCSTHQIALSRGLVIWSFRIEPISLAFSAYFGSWITVSRAYKTNTYYTY